MANENQRKSRIQEKRITKSFNQIREQAKQSINSGSLWVSKSDVITKHFRVEAKTKVKPSNSMVLQKEWFRKIEQEAFETGKVGIVVFSFGDGEDIVGINLRDFLTLVEELNELKERCKSNEES